MLRVALSLRVAKMPIGVYDRDLVQNIARRYEEETKTTYLLYHQTTHPLRPERSGLVRYGPVSQCGQCTNKCRYPNTASDLSSNLLLASGSLFVSCFFANNRFTLSVHVEASRVVLCLPWTMYDGSVDAFFNCNDEKQEIKLQWPCG
jgi:hypothetical protein